ncbi:MAG: NUDIX hydrolase [Acidimicrobiia bacterium]|nr:NUDIX hydrolase [Acidimicrobiia bacterium]
MTAIDPFEVELRLAATVMLVRHSDAGPEVFMLRRNPASAFVAGAFVFPGGAVDDHDRLDPDLGDITAGLTDTDASTRLGIESGGLAFWVAVIRECFEESGLLVARDHTGDIIRLDDPEVAARFAEHRRAVDAGEERLVEVCEQEGLTLACDSIHYFSHWVTPVGPVRRYDTRFFVARAPEAQVGAHDNGETVANLWVRPADALERRDSGELEMILPTVRNLEAIARFDDVDSLMGAAAALTDVPAMLPRLVQEDGGVRILLPGDPGYDHATPPATAMAAGTPLPGQAGTPLQGGHTK